MKALDALLVEIDFQFYLIVVNSKNFCDYFFLFPAALLAALCSSNTQHTHAASPSPFCPSISLIFFPSLCVCMCAGLIVPQVTYSVHISALCRSPLLHIRLWSAGRPWAITVSLKGGWGDAGLINQSNFLSLCQRGDGSKWILSR